MYDQMHGHGTFSWGNGNVYSGEVPGTATYFLNSSSNKSNLLCSKFTFDKKNGEGEYIWASKSHYIGGFLDDRQVFSRPLSPDLWLCVRSAGGAVKFSCACFGVLADLQTVRRKHGQGILHTSGGNTYDGSWVEDKKVGHGIFTWANGGE